MEATVSPFPYLEAVGFMVCMHLLFETDLDIQQHAALKLSNLPAPLTPLNREGLYTCSTKVLVTCLCLYNTDLSSWKDTLMNLLDNWLQRPVRRRGTEI
jgi:hypothetical protein